MKRTFTAQEKEFIFDTWKMGIGFSDIAKIIDSKPGTIFTVLRDTGGIKPQKRKRSPSHLTLAEREEIRAGPNMAWVSDITDVRTYEGFLYVATVMDLFSRRVVGWAMDKHIDRHLVINALLMSVWQRQPKHEVLVHSDQGSQYASSDYLTFMKEHHLIPSMSRRGNCHDNAVAESFFATFKKRVTKGKTYSTREEAKAEIFNFIEMFYNPIKRHSHTGGVSPVKFEEAYFLEATNV